MPEVSGRGIRTKWKTQGDCGHWPRRVESWAECDPDRDSPWPSWRGGLCEKSGPSLYRGSHRIKQEDFSPPKKTLWGTLGNSPAATASVSSPPHHPSGGCMHLISEGPETTGTTQGRVPSEWECLHLISEGTETTGTRESANQGRLCTHTHRPEKAYHKKRGGRRWEHQDSSWKRKPTNKGITNR